MPHAPKLRIRSRKSPFATHDLAPWRRVLSIGLRSIGYRDARCDWLSGAARIIGPGSASGNSAPGSSGRPPPPPPPPPHLAPGPPLLHHTPILQPHPHALLRPFCGPPS